jgi:hypothetical protein
VPEWLQQLLGEVLDWYLSRQRGAWGYMHVKPRLHPWL